MSIERIPIERLSLADRIDALPHQRLDLTGGSDDGRNLDPHRPKLSVWAECEDEAGPRVILSIDALWGQCARFVSFTPEEAKKLARSLIVMAADVTEQAES